MKRTVGVFLCVLGMLGGCEPAGGGALSPLDTGCTESTESCYCPDGTESGTQSCEDGLGLSECVCEVAFEFPLPAGGSDDPVHVCEELRGATTCNARSYVSEQVPSSILFVVDRSGSMACNTPDVQSVEDCNGNPRRADPSQPSRWEITVDALNEAFAGLSGSTATVGLSLFSSDGFCGVDAAPAVELAAPSATHLSALSAAMAGTSPSGGTPIVGSVILGYRHLHQDLQAPGNRYVVLITDGEESCGTNGDETDEADLEAARTRLLATEVGKAREANVKTFVVGAPGSEGARGFLSELAYLGGTARSPDCVHADASNGDCHFDLTAGGDFAAVLRDTLGQISGEALGCEFQVPPGGDGKVNVQYTQNGGTPTCFAQDTAPCDDVANGWQFAKDAAGNDDPSRVVLCGDACAAVQADPTAVVDVVLGCDVIQ